jgi:hypothetical protein
MGEPAFEYRRLSPDALSRDAPEEGRLRSRPIDTGNTKEAVTMDKVTIDVTTQAAEPIREATWETIELRRTIARAREEVARLALSPPELETVNGSLDAAAREAAATRPDRYEVGEHLGAAARVLKDAGALVGAGSALFQALLRATEVLGPAGLATVGAIL